MEPDHRSAFRRELRRDAYPEPATEPAIRPDLVNPHHPGPECGDTHCYVHHVDESDVSAWRVCGECFHVYLTAEALREAWAEITADAYALPPGTDVIAPPVEQIYACPYCLHNW